METLPVSHQIVKPEDCVFTFGIPTSLEAFEAARAHPNKEFARLFGENDRVARAKYEYEVLRYIDRVLPVYQALGVRIVRKLELAHFGRLLHAGSKVLILCSHWNDEAVEFYDGFADTASIMSQFPEHFQGVTDLCVCRSRSLAYAIKKQYPHALIRYANKPAAPYIWLPFYIDIFRYLKVQDVSYPEAVSVCVSRVIRKTRDAAP